MIVTFFWVYLTIAAFVLGCYAGSHGLRISLLWLPILVIWIVKKPLPSIKNMFYTRTWLGTTILIRKWSKEERDAWTVKSSKRVLKSGRVKHNKRLTKWLKQHIHEV